MQTRDCNAKKNQAQAKYECGQGHNGNRNQDRSLNFALKNSFRVSIKAVVDC